ncbi:MAG: hypothetical protein EAZ73_09260 [Oscillatoriales cyanobacterium]|uniref:hypothetical protein n=1 Tax=unclassified Microcoleus TaxID=2642155 RepID=UPI001D850C98|nr:MULTISPECIES: hypothetical protein [unclassified Microcoleus]TAF00838.1 MAG: hypothetical protein EAZ79_01335 [Oscillatoriales cyanobacterium]MCC3459824.1 hypothetical protein [Microcoleus sp. PH2017_11_PCY_U_A]MCC3478257.1 hypothetical protein [Microcoleus sp. PH2017_12_PCY_D_A]TAF21403.1 MAG: hypothetical protein EAZ73_09260 [Oscillatoriales cyanobacterium]TAF39670.1 MAG: hypothetical protein EAZ69_00085 [Oscillatoriales cyanobacterium]
MAIVKYDAGKLAVSSSQQKTLFDAVKSFGFTDTILQSLNDHYAVDISNIASWTNADFARFADVAEQFRELRKLIPKMKSQWQDIVDGTVEWSEAQAEMVKQGFDSARKVKKSTVDMAIAEAKFLARNGVQDHRLESKKTVIEHQATEDKRLIDSKEIVFLQQATDKVNAAFTNFQESIAAGIASAQEIEQWKSELVDEYEAAKLFLTYGSDAETHPKVVGGGFGVGGNDRSDRPKTFIASGSQQQQLPTGRSPDSISFSWSGNIAKNVLGTTKKIGGGIAKGASKLKKFFS